MSKVEYGSSTITGTGNVYFSLNDYTLTPSRVALWIASSTTETAGGFSDLTTKFTGSSAYADENTTKSITYYRNKNGTKTKVFEADVTSFGTGQFILNVTTWTEITKLYFVAFGD